MNHSDRNLAGIRKGKGNEIYLILKEVRTAVFQENYGLEFAAKWVKEIYDSTSADGESGQNCLIHQIDDLAIFLRIVKDFHQPISLCQLNPAYYKDICIIINIFKVSH